MAYEDIRGAYGGYNAEGSDPPLVDKAPGSVDEFHAWQKKVAEEKAKQAALEAQKQQQNLGAPPSGLDPVESFVYGGQSADMPDWYGAENGRVGALQSPEMYGVQGDINKQMDWGAVARERANGRWLQSSMAYDAARNAAQSGAESYARSGGYGSSLSRRAAQEMAMAGQGMSGERAQAEQLERDQWAKQYAAWMGDAQKSSYADAELRNKWAIEREKLLRDQKARAFNEGNRKYSGALDLLQTRAYGAKDVLNRGVRDAQADASMNAELGKGSAGMAVSIGNIFQRQSGYGRPPQTQSGGVDDGWGDGFGMDNEWKD